MCVSRSFERRMTKSSPKCLVSITRQSSCSLSSQISVPPAEEVVLENVLLTFLLRVHCLLDAGKYFVFGIVRRCSPWTIPDVVNAMKLPESSAPLFTEFACNDLCFPWAQTIPANFVREFGGYVHDVIRVKMAGATRLWNVKLNVYFMKKQPHVSFGAGWKQFMRENCILQGQTVKVTLTGTSLFEVSRVRNSGAQFPAQQGHGRRRSSRLVGVRSYRAYDAHRNRMRNGSSANASDIIVIDD